MHRELSGKYTLRALNRRPVAGVECHLADLGDLDAIRPAFDGVDAVVHLAAASGDNKTPADILRSNVTGTYHVFEAARLAGVSRVIFASSGATVAGWERDAAVEPPGGRTLRRGRDLAAADARVAGAAERALRRQQGVGRGARRATTPTPTACR